jgi:polyisoprenoid-binding protein YceI
VEGRFKLFDGSMESTKPDYSDAKINFTVDVNSLNTDNEMRDKHLKSDDFFNAEKYPAMKFQSTSFTPAGGNKYKLAGNLTIRDVTKPVVFDVTYGGTVTTQGKTKLGFKAKTSIDRFDYNLKWNKATEAGGLVVSKEVDLIVNVEMNKA